MTRMILAFAALLSLSLPARAVDVQEVTSPGGINAWLVEEHSIPFTALEIRFRGGSAMDPEGQRGVTTLMMALLEEGAGDMDAQGFAVATESLAASYGFDAYDDAISVSAKFLTENRDEAVALLKTAITQPRFDAEAIDRVKAQIVSIIRSDATDPGEIASRTFAEGSWGNHFYATAREGTEETIAALTAADLEAARLRVMVRDRIYVSAVGDITPDELGALLDNLLGDLPQSGPDLPDRAVYQGEGGVTVVPFDAPQSIAFFGHQGIARDDPDYIPAFMLNEIFGGGGFESRLMQEVREKRGLTYGVSTFLYPAEFGDQFIGRVASDNVKMAETVDVIRTEWAKIAETGLTEDELEFAKTYLTGAYALRFDGNAKIAGIMVGMQMVGLPPSYIDERNDMVRAVTLEEINRVAARLFDPEALRFVVVGQPVGLTNE